MPIREISWPERQHRQSQNRMCAAGIGSISLEFKNYFSSQSAEYAKYRPDYPPELYGFLSNLTDGHDLAWDCGCGNGQAALALSSYYGRIIATDPSAGQLEQALRAQNIEYRQEAAEETSLSDASADLIVSARRRTGSIWKNSIRRRGARQRSPLSLRSGVMN